MFVTVLTCFTVWFPLDKLSAQNSDSLVIKSDSTLNNLECIYFVEELAEFPGGEKAFHEFIIKNLVYPEDAKKLAQSGKVYVQFVILEDGNVDQDKVKVMRGEYELLNAEAIRVIKSMPKWKPGKQLGKSVKNIFVVPIHFKL